jgi:hypothetical protein
MRFKKLDLSKKAKRVCATWTVTNFLIFTAQLFTPLKENADFMIGSWFIVLFFSIYVVYILRKDMLSK